MKNALIIAIVFLLSESLFAQQIILDKIEPRLKAKALPETERMQLLIDVAQAYLYVDFLKALDYAEEAIELAQKTGDKKAWIRALTIKGRADIGLGNGDAAKSEYETALNESLRLNDLQTQVRARIGLTYLDMVAAQIDKGLSEIEIATKIADSIHDTEGLIELYYLHSTFLSVIGNHELSLAMIDKAISMCTQTIGTSLLPLLKAHRGYTLACLGNVEGARKEIELAMESAKIDGNEVGLECLFLNLCATYWFGSNMQKALENSLKGRTIAERVHDNWTLTNSLASISSIYGILEDYEKSFQYAQETLGMARRYGFTDLILDALGRAGYAARGLKQQEVCLSAYLEMARMADSLHNESYQLEANISLGNSYYNFGQADMALPFAMQAVEQALAYDDASSLSRAFVVKGNAILDASNEALINAGIPLNKRLELALEAYQSVVSDKPEFLDRMSYSAFLGISDVYERQGKYENALIYFKRAKTVHDSLLNAEKNEAISGLQIAYDTERKEREILELGKEKEEQLRKIQIQRSVVKGLIGVGSLLFVFAIVFFTQRNKIKRGKKRSDELLLNILPEEVAEELKLKGSADAQLIEHVTVLFTDFKGFTSMSEKLSPKELVADLHECFSAFDLITEKYGLEKIKTIGDAYMAAGGLPTINTTHASDAIHAALEMRSFIEKGRKQKISSGTPYFEVRIGIHTGPVVAGIVGVKKFQYDIWGDTVNTASRMESSGEAGEVNISETTYALVKNEFDCTYRGMVQAKGKGEMKMYFVQGPI